jgi:hypothetical protein
MSPLPIPLPPIYAWVFQVVSFPQVSPPKLCIYHFSPIHTTCPAHFILLDLITRIIIGEQYRSFSSSLCSFVHSPVTSSLLGPNIYIWLLVLMLYFVIRLLSPHIKTQGLNWIINIVSHYTQQKHLFALVTKN